MSMTRIDLSQDYGVSLSKNLSRRGFGVERGNRILLHPVEVAYLATAGNRVYLNGRELSVLEVLRWCFKRRENVLLFFAYRDLRNRGKRIRVDGNFLAGKHVFLPVSERDFLNFEDICGKNFYLAVVDEEGDVTYYRHFEWDCTGEQEEDIPRFEGVFAGDRVVTTAKHVFEKFFYGSLRDGVVTLSLVEALYLLEKGVIELDVSREELVKVALDVEKNFLDRYTVYRDLKERGFVVKTGFKFGSDFRVYEKVESTRDLPHSKYLVKVADGMRISDIASHVRVAGVVRKKMLFCFDTERLRYLCIERVRI